MLKQLTVCDNRKHNGIDNIMGINIDTGVTNIMSFWVSIVSENLRYSLSRFFNYIIVQGFADVNYPVNIFDWELLENLGVNRD